MSTSRSLLTASTALALGLTAWGPAQAQQQQQPVQQQPVQQQQPMQQPAVQQPGIQVGDQERVDLVTWREAFDELQAGWTATWMYNQPVYDVNGNEVGTVRSIFVGPEGRIQSIVMDTGGFIGIGTVPIRIPWQEVSFTQDGRILADVREENLPNFELFADEPEPQRRAFRAEELIGDFAQLQDEPAYGYVSDIIFDEAGEVQAVVVTPGHGYGTRFGAPYGHYAYPWHGYGYGFAPGAPHYGLPYTTEEVAGMEPFEYEALMGPGTMAGQTATGGGAQAPGQQGGQVPTGGGAQQQQQQVQPQ